MKQTSKWPAIDPMFKDRVIDYFSKCNKMGRPLKASRIKPEIDIVKSIVLYMPVWGSDETCWVDNEIITIKVFSYRDSPHKYMLVTARTRSGEVDNHYYTCTTVEHQADAGDIEWLERLVRERE